MEIKFDVLDTSELIALDCLMEDLSDEGKQEYIHRYKNKFPDKWEAYLDHRKMMGYSEL